MQNNVPSVQEQRRPSIADQAVDRALRGKRETAANEVHRLVEAALVVIERTGSLEPTVSEIVKQAGLHNQAFYRHFRSKRELLVAVLDRGIALLASYLEHRMESVSSPDERVREWVRGVLEQALHAEGAEATRPFVLARGRLAEAYPDEVRASEQQLTAPLRDAIAAGTVSGDFPNASPDRDAETLYLLAMGWVQNALTLPHASAREDASALESFAMAGLARRETGA